MRAIVTDEEIAASEFKARCLALIDRVHETGQAIIITKHGKPMVRLVREDPGDARPHEDLRGSAVLQGDPFAPVLEEKDIEVLR